MWKFGSQYILSGIHGNLVLLGVYSIISLIMRKQRFDTWCSESSSCSWCDFMLCGNAGLIILWKLNSIILFFTFFLFRHSDTHELFTLFSEGVQGPQRQHSLGWHISFIKWEYCLSEWISRMYLFLFTPIQAGDQCSILIWCCFFAIFRSVAEFSRIPVVVTNQVRSQSRDETSHYSFQGIVVH